MDLGGFGNFKGNAGVKSLANAHADSWSVVGKNIIVKGNVFIPYQNYAIYADSAIINTETKDIEAIGNVRVYRTKQSTKTLTIDQLDALRNYPNIVTTIDEYTTNVFGVQTIKVTIRERGDAIKASKISGNMATGLMEFQNLEIKLNNFLCKAKYGVRKPGGELIVEDAKLTTCEYMASNHEHYSLLCNQAKIYPRNGVNSFGFAGYNPDIGEHHVFMTGVTMQVMGLPVFWMPFMYKPPDESPGLFQVHGGETKNWGGFISTSKRFTWSDDPYISTKVMLDWFSLRGVGYGMDTDIHAPGSTTNIFAYSIHDIRPHQEYKRHTNGNLRRMDIPHARYNFKITNLTEITPRLDFRGRFELLSDIYFRDEFFNDAASIYPQPTTFGALEYQGDNFSTSLYVRARANDFYTVVEKLPEFSLNIPRQELFKNIYYQGDMKMGYYRMRWREFDHPRVLGNMVEPDNYDSGRFDSLHFLYYPIKLGWLNITPRAGLRFTAYSNSSKNAINPGDLATMFIVDNPEGNSNLNVRNYDDDGGSKARFIAEFGVEATTKISRSWQNVKSAYWQLDGMRHIMEPYVNYTFITDPSESRDHLYYFDEVDRITEQNFVRFGVKNRLQTRRGEYGSEKIYNWLSMENYIDYRFKTQDDFNALGDLGTRLTFTPHQDISFDTTLILDTGQSNEHKAKTQRHGRTYDRKGIDNKLINRWDANIRYRIIEDVIARFSYSYRDQYASESAYSMGSTLSNFDTGTMFNKYNIGRSQTFTFGLDFPITPDRRTRGAYEINYDVEEGAIRDQRIRITHSLHCWQLAVELIAERDWDAKDGSDIDYSVMATLTLNELAGPMTQIQHKGYSSYNSRFGDGS
jgi:lipopolysaccharide assembly outer membrane protein LptD (OstA)